jgi:multiple sugar transport system permease protein
MSYKKKQDLPQQLRPRQLRLQQLRVRQRQRRPFRPLRQLLPRLLRIALYIVFGALAAIALLPMAYTLANSFVGYAEFHKYYGALGGEAGAGNPFHMIPDRAVLQGYYDMLIARPDYLMKFWTSLGLGSAIALGQLATAALGGYAFSKFRFPGRDGIFFVIIILMMMPLQVSLPPNYMVLSRMGLIDSYFSIVLPGIFSPFGIFLMRQFMAAIPESLPESAKIDGAGRVRALWSVILPNCSAGMATLVVLSFIDSWNMVEAPLVFLRDPHKQPLAVFLSRVNSMEPSLAFACGALSIIAPLLLFLFFQKEMAEGIGYSIIK